MSAPSAVHDALIIGTGFAGIGMAITLKRSGRHDFVILETDDDLGAPGETTPTPAGPATCHRRCPAAGSP